MSSSLTTGCAVCWASGDAGKPKANRVSLTKARVTARAFDDTGRIPVVCGGDRYGLIGGSVSVRQCSWPLPAVLAQAPCQLLRDPRPNVARLAVEPPQWIPALLDFMAHGARYAASTAPTYPPSASRPPPCSAWAAP